MEFTLKIELGNDAMMFGPDVAQALTKVAERISALTEPFEVLDPFDRHGQIMDENGKKVGSWKITV
jgi:hypothetical protein